MVINLLNQEDLLIIHQQQFIKVMDLLQKQKENFYKENFSLISNHKF